MKPEIEWIDLKLNDGQCFNGNWDEFRFSCYDIRNDLVVAVAWKDQSMISLVENFVHDENGFDKAKSWCESMIPHLIAEDICDGQ
jgi:hypothetical protein